MFKKYVVLKKKVTLLFVSLSLHKTTIPQNFDKTDESHTQYNNKMSGKYLMKTKHNTINLYRVNTMSTRVKL